MNICDRPIYEKPAKAKPNPAYLSRVRDLPCVICEGWGLPQLSPTAAHHPIHGRYGNRKLPDEQAIPLCEGHHQGNFDLSKLALHRAPSKWQRMFGPDHGFIAGTQERLSND